MKTGVIEFDEAIAITIRQLRRDELLSQDTIAIVLGVSKQNVSNIENQRASLTMHNLWKLAEFYKIKPSEILQQAESLVGKDIIR